MISLYNVLESVVEVTCIYPDAILGLRRNKEIAMARHLFCYLARLHTNSSQEAIGEFLGGRHHTTVIHSLKTANDMLDTNYEVFGDMINHCNSIIAMRWKQDFTFTVTIPYGVEFTKVKSALEVFGVTIK